MQGRNLIHQLLVHSQTAGGIHNHHGDSFRLGFGDGRAGNLHRVLLPFFGIDRNADLLAQHFQLVDSGGAEGIASGQQDLHAAFALDIQGQFARESRLTGTVQTGDEHHCRTSLQVYVLGRASHEISQLIMDYLHHHLLRLHGRKHVLAHGLLLHRVTELLGHLIAHIGIQQRPPDILQRLGYIDLGNLPFTLQYLERAFQSFL